MTASASRSAPFRFPETAQLAIVDADRGVRRREIERVKVAGFLKPLQQRQARGEGLGVAPPVFDHNQQIVFDGQSIVVGGAECGEPDSESLPQRVLGAREIALVVQHVAHFVERMRDVIALLAVERPKYPDSFAEGGFGFIVTPEISQHLAQLHPLAADRFAAVAERGAVGCRKVSARPRSRQPRYCPNQ